MIGITYSCGGWWLARSLFGCLSLVPGKMSGVASRRFLVVFVDGFDACILLALCRWFRRSYPPASAAHDSCCSDSRECCYLIVCLVCHILSRVWKPRNAESKEKIARGSIP